MEREEGNEDECSVKSLLFVLFFPSKHLTQTVEQINVCEILTISDKRGENTGKEHEVDEAMK